MWMKKAPVKDQPLQDYQARTADSPTRVFGLKVKCSICFTKMLTYPQEHSLNLSEVSLCYVYDFLPSM